MEKKKSQWDVKPAIVTTVSPDKLKVKCEDKVKVFAQYLILHRSLKS